MSDAAPAPEPAAPALAPTQAAPETRREALGVAEILTSVLAIFFKRLPKILLLALPSGLAMAGLFYLGFAVLESVWGRWSYDILIPFVLVAITFGTGLGLASGPLTEGLRIYERNGELPFWICLGRIWRQLVPSIVCGIVTALFTLVPLWLISLASSGRVGLFIAVVAIALGMYGCALWGLSVSSSSQERIGVAALRRGQRLSQGYRWQVAGTCFLIFFTAILISGLVGAGLALIARLLISEITFFGEFVSLWEALAFIDLCLAAMILIALIALGLAAIRTRLIEIKEPPDIEDMVAVFD